MGTTTHYFYKWPMKRKQQKYYKYLIKWVLNYLVFYKVTFNWIHLIVSLKQSQTVLHFFTDSEQLVKLNSGHSLGTVLAVRKVVL